MEKGAKIWMDGALVDWSAATVPVMSHTLHYGLGVFEGIRCYDCAEKGSAIFRLNDHVERLFASAHIADIKIPYHQNEIVEAVKATMKASGLKSGYIRPLVYLGEGGFGILPQNNPVKTAIAAWGWGAYLGEEGVKNGIRVKVSSFVRYHVNSFMSKSKLVGNYVNSVFAKREAVSGGYDEAILLDTEGYVAEGSGENIFIIKDGTIKTTPMNSVLKGITRDSVMRIASDRGIKIKEERFTRDELYIADEAFFTGTAAEVTPIREVDGRAIGEGRPGPMTKELQSIFFDAVRGRREEYSEWLLFI